jgi:hypothetical protein
VPARLVELLAAFPAGSVQLEVGIQTFSPAVSRLLARPCHPARIERGLTTLLERTGVHLHTDLIAGLPGEGVAAFAAGFDRLAGLGVHEIQVGLLKLLPGAPLAELVEPFDLRFDPAPPYEVLSTAAIPFPEMQRLKRFARAWLLVGNSGNFTRTLPRLLRGASAFQAFDAFAVALWGRLGRTSGVALDVLVGEVFRWLTDERGLPAAEVALDLAADWAAGGRRGVPEVLRPWASTGGVLDAARATGLQRRQARHRA